MERVRKGAAIIAADDKFIGFLGDSWGLNPTFRDYRRSYAIDNLQIVYLTSNTADGEPYHGIEIAVIRRCIPGNDPRIICQQVLW